MDAAYLIQAVNAEKELHPFAFQYDSIFGALRWAIITERFEPRQTLRIGEIAKLLDISRTPVARAFAMLESERLVTSVGKSTYLVAAPDYRSIRDIMEFRYMIEPAIAYCAAKNSTMKEVEALEKLLEQFKTLDPLSARSTEYVDAVYRVEVAFHSKVCDMCGNFYMQKSWKENLTSICRSIYFTQRSAVESMPMYSNILQRGGGTYSSHAPIVYSIGVKDGHMAMQASYSHLRKINLKSIPYEAL